MSLKSGLGETEMTTDKRLRKRTAGGIFTKVRAFVICVSLLQLVQVMGSGYGKSALTSVQRRYRLSTFSMGLLQSCFHIGNLSVILFVSYFGSKWNRPRAIAIGTLMMAASSLMSALPQFVGCRYKLHQDIQPHYSKLSRDNFASNDMLLVNDSREFALQFWDEAERELSTKDWLKFKLNPFTYLQHKSSLCKAKPPNKTVKHVTRNDFEYNLQNHPQIAKYVEQLNKRQLSVNLRTSNQSSEDGDWDDSYLFIFIAVGSILKGMGHSPLHPLGMSYIDDHATVRNSAVYIGFVSALSLLGPAFGFILGSLTTNIWVDYGWTYPKEYNFVTPADKEWVGAWWLGYIVTGILLIIATIPFCLFPRSCEKEAEEDCDTEESSCLLCIKSCYGNNKQAKCQTHVNNVYSGIYDSAKELNDSKANLYVTTHVTSQRSLFEHQLDDLFDDVEKNNNHATNQSNDVAIGNQMKTDSVDLITRSWYEIGYNQDNKKDVIAFLGGSDWTRSNSGLGNRQSVIIPYSKSEWNASERSRNANCDETNKQTQWRLQKSASVPGIYDKHRFPKFNRHCQSHKLRNGVLSDSIRSKLSRHSRKASLSIPHLPIGDFFRTLKGLLTDGAFICVTMAFVCLTSFLAASVTYAAKYMETQFSLTASMANLLNGSVNLPMAVVGNLLGGWSIRRFNLNVHKTMCVAITGFILTTILVLVLLFLGCDPNALSTYARTNQSQSCSMNCNCDDETNPVCDVITNITYQSACHAGCSVVKSWKGTQIYSHCLCLLETSRSVNASENVMETGTRLLLSGPCETSDCSQSYLPMFVVTMGICSLTAGLASTPSSLVILRIVPPTDKAIAIAVYFVFTRVLAWIPSPVYVGSAIDASCLRWTEMFPSRDADETEYEEQARHHCDMYDKALLRRNFFTVAAAQLTCGIVFYIFALYLESKRGRNGQNELIEEKKSNCSFDGDKMNIDESKSGAGVTTTTRLSSYDEEIYNCENEINV